MNANRENAQQVALARLTQDGVLRVAGADARAFLHAQLTNDIENLASDHVRRAGWCTAKGRLLATPLVVPQADDFLLLLPRELVNSVMKRLRMFVLRAKVTIEDDSGRWEHIGLLGEGALQTLSARMGVEIPAAVHALVRAHGAIVIRVEGDRARMLVAAGDVAALVERLGLRAVDESRWMMEDIRMGLPQVVAATQELFVPQMLNFEAIAGLDFKKGCYPGQEIVARARYRGQVKRHMRRARVAASAAPVVGQDLYCDDQPGQACGTVVAVAALDGDSELLAVVPTAAAQTQLPVRLAPGGTALEWLPLPYAV